MKRFPTYHPYAAHSKGAARTSQPQWRSLETDVTIQPEPGVAERQTLRT
jgi:hypothetical protein